MKRKILTQDQKVKIQNIIKNNPNSTWHELGLLINKTLNIDFKSDTYRLMSGIDISEKKINQIAKAKNDLMIERKLIQHQKNILNKMLKELSQRKNLENIFENVSKNISKIELGEIRKFRNKDDKNTYMVTITDFHYLGDDIDGWKFSKITQKILELIKQHNIKQLIINELGDSIEGTIHLNGINLYKGADEIMAEYTIHFLNLISIVSQHCKVICNVVTSSNHTQTRPFNTSRNELKQEDRMFFLSTMLKNYAKSNKNVIVYDGEELIFEMMGFNVLLTHGHKIKNSGKRYLADYSSSRNIVIDYLIQGHWHYFQQQTISQGLTTNGKLYDKMHFIMPALCGNNEYGISNNFSGTPAFGFSIFNKKYGHQTTQVIYLKK